MKALCDFRRSNLSYTSKSFNGDEPGTLTQAVSEFLKEPPTLFGTPTLKLPSAAVLRKLLSAH
jgi:hypothetical protein